MIPRTRAAASKWPSLSNSRGEIRAQTAIENSNRASIGEAAGIRIAMPPLQRASDGSYAPCQTAGWAGHMANVGLSLRRPQMDHPLDRPVWNALTTSHATFAQGGTRARCYPPEIMPLGATLDGSSESFAALRALMPEGGFLA